MLLTKDAYLIHVFECLYFHFQVSSRRLLAIQVDRNARRNIRGVHKLRCKDFFHLFTTYLPPVDISEGILLLLKRKDMHTVVISSTTYQPHLVNVVCERPLMLRLSLLNTYLL